MQKFRPLYSLAARMQAELTKYSPVSLELGEEAVLVAYRRLPFLCWSASEAGLVCSPLGWHRRPIVAETPAQAHQLTMRLVFEFVSEYRWNR